MIYNDKQRKLILLGLIFFLGVFILFALKDFVTSVIGSVIVYTLFKPLYIHFTNKSHWNRKAAALTIIVLSFFIILIPFFSVSWMLIGKIIQFRSNPEEINLVIEKIDNYVGVNFNQPDFIPNMLNRLETWLAGSFPSAISRALHILLLVIVMYFIVFFMFIHYEYFENMLLKYVPFPERMHSYLQMSSRILPMPVLLVKASLPVLREFFWVWDF
jgi:predicted PurR-regulated permease PerM